MNNLIKLFLEYLRKPTDLLHQPGLISLGRFYITNLISYQLTSDFMSLLHLPIVLHIYSYIGSCLFRYIFVLFILVSIRCLSILLVISKSKILALSSPVFLILFLISAPAVLLFFVLFFYMVVVFLDICRGLVSGLRLPPLPPPLAPPPIYVCSPG